MKIIIRLKKRKKPTLEFEQFAKEVFGRNFFLFFEIVRLRVQFGLIIATPAKEVKKMRLRQIIKEVGILRDKMED